MNWNRISAKLCGKPACRQVNRQEGSRLRGEEKNNHKGLKEGSKDTKEDMDGENMNTRLTINELRSQI
jgi:hypothetical protein